MLAKNALYLHDRRIAALAAATDVLDRHARPGGDCGGWCRRSFIRRLPANCRSCSRSAMNSSLAALTDRRSRSGSPKSPTRSPAVPASILLAQACVVLTYYAVFSLARAIVGIHHATFAVLLMVGISAFTAPTPNFGPAVLAMPVGAFALLYLWRAIGERRRAAWYLLAPDNGLAAAHHLCGAHPPRRDHRVPGGDAARTAGVAHRRSLARRHASRRGGVPASDVARHRRRSAAVTICAPCMHGASPRFLPDWLDQLGLLFGWLCGRRRAARARRQMVFAQRRKSAGIRAQLHRSVRAALRLFLRRGARSLPRPPARSGCTSA